MAANRLQHVEQIARRLQHAAQDQGAHDAEAAPRPDRRLVLQPRLRKNPTSLEIAAISLSENPSDTYKGIAITPAIASPNLVAHHEDENR